MDMNRWNRIDRRLSRLDHPGNRGRKTVRYDSGSQSESDQKTKDLLDHQSKECIPLYEFVVKVLEGSIVWRQQSNEDNLNSFRWLSWLGSWLNLIWSLEMKILFSSFKFQEEERVPWLEWRSWESRFSTTFLFRWSELSCMLHTTPPHHTSDLFTDSLDCCSDGKTKNNVQNWTGRGSATSSTSPISALPPIISTLP